MNDNDKFKSVFYSYFNLYSERSVKFLCKTYITLKFHFGNSNFNDDNYL